MNSLPFAAIRSELKTAVVSPTLAAYLRGPKSSKYQNGSKVLLDEIAPVKGLQENAGTTVLLLHSGEPNSNFYSCSYLSKQFSHRYRLPNWISRLETLIIYIP